MKRLFVLALTLIVLIGALTITVSAEGSGSLSATGVTGYRGDTVAVNVNLGSNPGLITMKFQVSYSSNLTLVSVNNSGLLAGWTTPSPTISSPYTLRWADSLSTVNNTATGTLVTLYFKIAENAPFGTETVSIIFSESRDAVGGKNTFNSTAATITIACNHNYGSWTKVDDTNHGQTCSVCQNVQNEAHTWNSGTVTKQPTCKEEGVKTLTCTACSATKTESVAKTATHTYGNWTKANDTTHKHTCTVCSKEETANHIWDSGKITKQPTCKEEGVKTYTCTACSATKTESVAKTTAHTYGNWTKVNDTTHKHTCTVCSKEETANHTWNSGAVTKKATCKEEGVKTYTCTACNATKTESIAKLTTHTYDHACDTDCNVCGATRSTTHNYNTAWSKDKTNHWYECSVCKDKKDIAAHTPGAEATETKAQTCTTCNYVIKPALGHKHNYAATWTTDEAGHWYACSGCTEKDSYADHDFENDCDKDCSICSYTRETDHKFAEAWTSDANSHWRVCSGCGLKQDEAAHEPGAEATATTAQTCTICAYEIAPALGEPEPETTTEAPQETTTEEDSGTNANSQFPWWIIIVVVVVAISGAAAAVVIKKKK